MTCNLARLSPCGFMGTPGGNGKTGPAWWRAGAPGSESGKASAGRADCRSRPPVAWPAPTAQRGGTPGGNGGLGSAWRPAVRRAAIRHAPSRRHSSCAPPGARRPAAARQPRLRPRRRPQLAAPPRGWTLSARGRRAAAHCAAGGTAGETERLVRRGGRQRRRQRFVTRPRGGIVGAPPGTSGAARQQPRETKEPSTSLLPRSNAMGAAAGMDTRGPRSHGRCSSRSGRDARLFGLAAGGWPGWQAINIGQSLWSATS
jgi:hypothetical protein